MEKPHVEIRRTGHITEAKMNKQKNAPNFPVICLAASKRKKQPENNLVQHPTIHVPKSAVPNPSLLAPTAYQYRQSP